MHPKTVTRALKQGDAPSRRLRRHKCLKLKPYLGKVDKLLAAGVNNAVCFNPREAERQRRHRAKVLAELEAELATLRPGEGDHRKRVCELRASGRYGRYVRLTKRRLARIDRA